ncbi:MAG: hypothetical protein BWY09_01044 [Candidatus Hydrogenedentes bacterium ADurb.Bin179]|nr:MAG: hypothetical protein BWY09_01044 [Candidatus Hydrogenedentes bacterium ADurb.Bin179]
MEIEYAIGRRFVGCQGQIAVVGGDGIVKQDGAARLQGQRPAVTTGIVGEQGCRKRNIVVRLECNCRPGVQERRDLVDAHRAFISRVCAEGKRVSERATAARTGFDDVHPAGVHKAILIIVTGAHYSRSVGKGNDKR